MFEEVDFFLSLDSCHRLIAFVSSEDTPASAALVADVLRKVLKHWYEVVIFSGESMDGGNKCVLF